MSFPSLKDQQPPLLQIYFRFLSLEIGGALQIQKGGGKEIKLFYIIFFTIDQNGQVLF